MREKALSERKTDSISVHKLLIRRALPLLCSVIPECEKFYETLTDTLIGNVCKPDSSGDREKGLGYHYYCSVSFIGTKQRPKGGYLRNGCMRFTPSAGTMLEEDYTMALTMYHAGHPDASAQYLARAIHMISDMCCLPHALGMTYFSPRKPLHQAYEDLAKSLYTDFIPEQTITENDLHIFDDEKGFCRVMNRSAEIQRPEADEVLAEPKTAITKRLHAAEKHVAALMYRFYADTVISPDRSLYTADGDVFAVNRGNNEATVSVTENGIMLMLGDKPLSVKIGDEDISLFRIALRINGRFTFSPVGDKKNRIISEKNGRLIRFDPRKDDCFFEKRV